MYITSKYEILVIASVSEAIRNSVARTDYVSLFYAFVLIEPCVKTAEYFFTHS
jgi:hypothetical protein